MGPGLDQDRLNQDWVWTRTGLNPAYAKLKQQYSPDYRDNLCWSLSV